jgi:hypothetical protein
MVVMRATALAAVIALCAGCFGYNKSAKRWAYAGDTVLILGGGGVIAADLLTKPEACTGMNCPRYTAPVGGALVVGAMLAAAGVFGMILNATRDNVKTSR